MLQQIVDYDLDWPRFQHIGQGLAENSDER
jgi:hypothetical protein